jgi:hypothetical protein
LCLDQQSFLNAARLLPGASKIRSSKKEVSDEPGIASLPDNQQEVVQYDGQVVSTGKCELATT